ncbi:amino acid/polyamine/organocation transporter, APC superfamily [Oceanobacillus limi]|uniref:Amino acid/polyamine/organocation transporter, APC superfamily n=1 Tax=Oceanobacillus limi TaxID=930131 RepID=A0A1I0CCF9_9BACI|nr:amino acid permease [Oceanobacillus limi]SET16789.1 amino acid/polyamine/organocation transporter, APC superfamily [Oceanobacillus limi]
MNNKSIGLYQGIALYIAAILGSGVLFLTGVTASIAGPASILSWFIVILICFPLAYSFASLAQEYPDAGGAATFVRSSFGYHLGNIIGWFYFVTAAVGQTIVSLTGAFYVSQAFGYSHLETTVTAIFILVIAGVSNYYGVNVSGKVALILSSLLLILLLATIFVSIPRVQWGNFSPFVPNGWFSVGSAVTFIFWSFFGWEAICNLALYFKRPEKDIVKGAVVSAVVIGLLFLSLSLVTIGTATYGSKESNLSPIGVIMGDTVGLGAKVVTACLALIICTGTANAFVASLTQLGYSLSRNGAFPRFFSRLHATTQIPRKMVIFVISFSITGVLVTNALSLTFDDILFIPTSLGIIVYVLTMAAGIKLLRKNTMSWWASLVSFVMCLFVIPFFQLYIVVPLIVAVLYSSYMILSKKILSYKEGLKFHEGPK